MIKALWVWKFFSSGSLNLLEKCLKFVFKKAVWTLFPYHTHTHTLTQSSWRYTYSIFTFILTVSLTEWLTLSLSGIHNLSLHHRSFVTPLYGRRGIRSCVTELLSDIRAVQMDDRSTSAWPTDKKPSLFVRLSPLLSLFLPYPSLKAQLH